MLVIGSQALALQWPEKHLAVNDLDLVGTYDEALAYRKLIKSKTFYPINSGSTLVMDHPDYKKVEIEIAWPDSRAEKLLNFVKAQGNKAATAGLVIDFDVATPNLCYLLKMSHRYLKNSPHFYKTMADIRKLRDSGCYMLDSWKDFYEERMKDTYTYKHPKLNVMKNDFFNSEQNGIVMKYDHDWLHEVVAVEDKPAYTRYQPDDQEVNCSKDMFYEQTYYIRLLGVLEESCVLALERSLIPFPGKKTPEEAFKYALMKVCTSITSGWFREFAWENHNEVVTLFNVLRAKGWEYEKRLEEALTANQM